MGVLSPVTVGLGRSTPYGWKAPETAVCRVEKQEKKDYTVSDAGKEIIKSPDTGSISKRETTEDGIKGSFPEHAAPESDRSYFQFQSKQVRAQHTGREPRFRAKDRITVLHDGIGKGEIQIEELHDIVPGAFGKNKGVGIKLKEIGYESILIGGMSASVAR